MFKAQYLYRAVFMPLAIMFAFATGPARADMVADMADTYTCYVHNFTSAIKYANYQHNPVERNC